MGIFSRFPYTDFHRLNADWILEKVKEAAASVAEALGLVQQSAADAAAAAAAAEQAAEGSVRYDRAQELTQAQQRQAQTNMNVVDASVTAMIQLSVSELNARAVQVDQPQSFTSEQQAQARSNIGAASAAGLTQLSDEVWGQGSAITTLQAGAVQADRIQAFTDAEKARARANIGAAEAGVVPSGAVRYDATQELTATQQAAARANIGAAAEGSGPAPVGAVLYDQAQSLTDAQQLRARDNIGAPAYSDPAFNGGISLTDDAAASSQGDELQISLVSTVGQSVVALAGSQSSYVILSGLAAPVNDRDAANKAYVWNSLLKELTASGTTPVIDLASEIDGTSYETLITCTGTAPTSITISTAVNSPLLATIVFTTGAAAPTFDSPLAINGLDDLIPEANTIYEISIRSNRAAWKSWEVSA